MTASLADLRKEYTRDGLREADADADPIVQFGRWFEQAVAAGAGEPNAMTLATVAADGRPSARVVLLKEADARGFAFYTNFSSRKGRELEGNRHAALVFFWPELERQVRIEGEVTVVDDAEADRYFASRPQGSQIGAWASPQSQPIEGREALEARVQGVEARFATAGAVPRPPNWGGYRVIPERIEFWQGRHSRLHDRLEYRRAPGATGWTRQRLAP